MKYLTGTEISVTFAGETVHIVGLGFDADDAAHARRACTTRAAGAARARRRWPPAWPRSASRAPTKARCKFVGNPELISRTHFARFLVETGVCKDTNEVFRKYLTEGKPGYVPHRWAIAEATRCSGSPRAGGMAVIAHPGRYKFTANEEYALFTEFKAHGGRASKS